MNYHSKSDHVRAVIRRGAPFRIAEVAQEVGCTPALVSQMKTIMRQEGEDFAEQVLPGRGMPAKFRLRSPHERHQQAEDHRRREQQREIARIRTELAGVLEATINQASAIEKIIRRLDALQT